jgi:gluconokinase
MSLATRIQNPVVLVVMGVTGSGKTTVASILARDLHWSYQDGDSLHPLSNIEKMKAGRPLTDGDRAPWLEKVAEWVDQHLDAGSSGIITCSALKRSYRDVINRRGSGVVFVFLSAAKETIAARLSARRDHFMPPTLLESQVADLEEPSPDEPALRVDASAAPDVIAETVMAELDLHARRPGRGPGANA